MRRALCDVWVMHSICPAVFPNDVTTLHAFRSARRWSQISNNKVEGYYRLTAKQISIPESQCEVVTSRGSGPGGQGSQSSSNKVELRVPRAALEECVDTETFQNLASSAAAPYLVDEGQWLVVSCHEHRSALKNKEECFVKVKELLQQASWVPAIPSDPVKLSHETISRHKMERRKKSNMLKMRSAARRGLW